MTTCPECNDTGERNSGGTHPWGEPVYLPCDCKDAEIGRRWREDSSLEKWFPITAERLAALEQWALDCRDQVLYQAAQRDNVIGKAADGLGQALAGFRLGAAAELERLRAENAALKHDLQYARDGLTKGRSRMREDNERLAREAHTWSKAAETYATELERHKPLMQAVEWILEDGHMNQEHLARLRAAWEGA